jgi:hypothetical protein
MRIAPAMAARLLLLLPPPASELSLLWLLLALAASERGSVAVAAPASMRASRVVFVRACVCCAYMVRCVFEYVRERLHLAALAIGCEGVRFEGVRGLAAVCVYVCVHARHLFHKLVTYSCMQATYNLLSVVVHRFY